MDICFSPRPPPSLSMRIFSELGHRSSAELDALPDEGRSSSDSELQAIWSPPLDTRGRCTTTNDPALSREPRHERTLLLSRRRAIGAELAPSLARISGWATFGTIPRPTPTLTSQRRTKKTPPPPPFPGHAIDRLSRLTLLQNEGVCFPPSRRGIQTGHVSFLPR